MFHHALTQLGCSMALIFAAIGLVLYVSCKKVTLPSHEVAAAQMQLPQNLSNPNTGFSVSLVYSSLIASISFFFSSASATRDVRTFSCSLSLSVTASISFRLDS